VLTLWCKHWGLDLKVLNLQCQHQHVFEGWFASEDDFQSQLASHLVECPLCGDKQISKMLSAPRLNLSTSRSEMSTELVTVEPDHAVSVPAVSAPTVMPPEVQAAWLNMVQHVMKHTEDVGSQFADEARKMHYGEAEERGIRGQVSAQETQALLEEGISVMPLPLPAALKGPVH
jgi:hypothetical protein